MKKLFVILMLICMTAALCGCENTDKPEATSPKESTAPTSDTKTSEVPTDPTGTEPAPEAETKPSEDPVTEPTTEPQVKPSDGPATTKPENPVELPSSRTLPYVVQVYDAEHPVHSGPGYRYDQVGTVKEAGLYTIVEEAFDNGDTLWGRLKSGVGWIPLTSGEKGANQVYIRRPDQPIFSGPSYDYDYLGIVSNAGNYTMVDTCWDEEGNLWGQLKSGRGWVNMTDIAIDASELSPMSAGYADGNLLSSRKYHWAELSDSEYINTVAFRAYEKLENVTLYPVHWNGEKYIGDETLYFLTEMTPDMPLVVQISFPGDMSAYGISFKDASGQSRGYVLTMSGRNGMLAFFEVTP